VATAALKTRRLWRRLGFREQADPEFVYAIQPVYNVGDGSALVPPTLPAVAWSGGAFTPAAGEHAAVEIQALAPGGCFVREITVAVPVGASTWRWAIRATTAGLGTLATRHDMGPTPILSRVTFDGVAGPGLLSATDPHRNIGTGAPVLLDDLIFIPAGQFFYIETSGANAFLTLTSVVFSDVAEEIPASAV